MLVRKGLLCYIYIYMVVRIFNLRRRENEIGARGINGCFFIYIFLMLWFFTWLPPMTYNLALHLLGVDFDIAYIIYLFMVLLRVVWTTWCLRW